MKLGEGTILELSGGAAGAGPAQEFRLSWRFRLEYGHTVQLESDTVDLTILDDGSEMKLRVERITYIESNLKDFGHLQPLDLMKGEGRTDHVKRGWGEYSFWDGGGDVYSLQVPTLGLVPDKVEVRLPTFFSDGQKVEIKPIRFTKTRDSQMCVQ